MMQCLGKTVETGGSQFTAEDGSEGAEVMLPGRLFQQQQMTRSDVAMETVPDNGTNNSK